MNKFDYKYLHILRYTPMAFWPIIFSAASLGSQGAPH